MQIKLFTNKKSFKKGGVNANPNLFWMLLLLLAFILIIISFIFSFVLFEKISEEAFLENGIESKKIDTIKQERLDNVLKYFSDRETKSLNILNFPSPIVDPSV
mgnify:CR=1 FL=1